MKSKLINHEFPIIDDFCSRIRDKVVEKLDQKQLDLLKSKIPRKANIQKKQWKKLEALKKQKSTVIKPSDKNTGTCISTDTLYSNECCRLLDDSSTCSQLKPQEKDEFLKKAAGDLIILLQKQCV